MFKNVLVPLDGSGLAEQVLHHATAVATSCECRVVLLRVVPSLRAVIAGDEDSSRLAEPFGQEEATHLEEEQAGVYLEWTAAALRAEGLEVACVVRRGAPAEEIIRYAKEHDIGLIAISTHGRSGLGRLVFGSVADRVLRESGLPVMVIKPLMSEVWVG